MQAAASPHWEGIGALHGGEVFVAWQSLREHSEIGWFFGLPMNCFFWSDSVNMSLVSGCLRRHDACIFWDSELNGCSLGCGSEIAVLCW